MKQTYDKLFSLALQTKQFIPGQCFLCLEPTKDNSVLHESCAIAYNDEKNKRLALAHKEAEEVYQKQKIVSV